MTVNKTTIIEDKGTNSRGPTTDHKIDQTSTAKTALSKSDSRMHKATKTENDCKIDSSQKGDWTYKYHKQKNKRILNYYKTAKEYKTLEEQVHKVGSIHRT